MEKRKKKVPRKKYFDAATGMVVGHKTFVSFIPAKDINCIPPYIKGKRDTCWTDIRGISPTNKKDAEERIGMELLPMD